MCAVRRAVWRPLAVYAVVALVFSWPLVVSLRTHLGAPEGPGDPYLNVWILGWDLRTITTHPSWLLTGRIFDANIFYPAASTLAYSDHQILQALLVLPIYLLSGDPVLCYNVLLIGSLIASGLAMHTLARSGARRRRRGTCRHCLGMLAVSRRPSHSPAAAGALFLPLAILFLLRVIAGGRRREPSDRPDGRPAGHVVDLLGSDDGHHARGDLRRHGRRRGAAALEDARRRARAGGHHRRAGGRRRSSGRTGDCSRRKASRATCMTRGGRRRTSRATCRCPSRT